MNKIGLSNLRTYFNRRVYFKQKVLIMTFFFFLAVIHYVLLAGYLKILMDSLYARIAARTLAQSRLYTLVEALEPMKGTVQIKQVVNIIDEMIALEDPETGIRFISGVKLEMDYDVIKAGKKALDLERGKTSGEYFLIPIYSKTTRELIGIAKFYSSQISLKESKIKYRLIMLIGAVSTLLITMIVLWLTLTHLFGKIITAEREIREKQAQLIHTGRLKAMGEMAAGIAHEINQPLQVIKSATPYLSAYFKDNDPQSVEAEAARDILKHVDRVTGIIRNMISFVRNEPDHLEITGLCEPLSKALSFFTEQFKNHSISLEVPDHALLEKLPDVMINLQEFMQIVVNLLSNARDAVDKRGKEAEEGYRKRVLIHLSHKPENLSHKPENLSHEPENLSHEPENLSHEPENLSYDPEMNAVMFEVKDNGIGMSQEVKDRCMEPFYTTKEAGEGMGLGLSIVYTLARKHGMSISIESVEGEGTAFRILIPAGKKGNRSTPSSLRGEGCQGAPVAGEGSEWLRRRQ
jgi:signal transduction histidine kinase